MTPTSARSPRPRAVPSRAVLAQPASTVGPRLLGATLTSDVGDRRVAVRVSEVEAYEGPLDPASHAYRGPTARNAIMFGPAGFLYVYFVYGMHWCANVVCGPDGTPSALLIRAGRVIEGADVARRRRPAARTEVELARGPARLAGCLGLDGSGNGVDLLAPDSPVRLTLPADAADPVATGPRVGVAAAASAPLRFWVEGDPTVSVYRPGGLRRPAARKNGRRADWPP